jgi:endonuclease VIII
VPEGDTVRRTAARLDQALAGSSLVRAELRWADLGAVDLAGRTVLGVAAYGKHLLTRFEAGDHQPALTLHSHLRMDGSWRIHATGSRPWPAATDHRVRAVLAGPRWTAVGMLLGVLELVPTDAEDTVLGHLGPDIMADGWDAGRLEVVRRLSAQPERHIGAAVLDQTNVAGIGTFYMAEALFVQRVSPWSTAGSVDLPAVLDTARRQLLVSVQHAVPTTTGDTVRGRTSYVHGRSGRPCRRCGGTVRVAPVGEPPMDRTAFYCPQCQPGPTPTDSGRPMGPLGSRPPRPFTPRNSNLRQLG